VELIPCVNESDEGARIKQEGIAECIDQRLCPTVEQFLCEKGEDKKYRLRLQDALATGKAWS